MDLDHLTLSIENSLTRLGLDGPPIAAVQQNRSELETTAHNRLVEEIATALGDHSEFDANTSLMVNSMGSLTGFGGYMLAAMVAREVRARGSARCATGLIGNTLDRTDG